MVFFFSLYLIVCKGFEISDITKQLIDWLIDWCHSFIYSFINWSIVITVRVFWTYAACRWGSSWPGSAVCLRRRCRDTGVCRAGWACRARPTSTPHTLRCCHWSRHRPPADGNTLKESKPIVENVFPHWCSQTKRSRQETSLISSPLIPGCCICSQCRRSPAVDNSHRPPAETKEEVW